MAPPAGTKRVKGVSIYRPFVFGSEARPIDPNKKPANLPPEHTHQWKVWVRGVDNEDISYWVKKVQFKLHETYANSLRTLDGPPFEVTETGWGEFEIQIKLHFVPESNEKPQTLWHALKLHPYGPDADAQRERRDPVVSMNYEEVVFNEPVEPFYDILTRGGVDKGKGKGKGKAAKAHASKGAAKDNHTAELPDRGPYSQEMEQRELDRMKEALKTVNKMIEEEKKRLGERETKFEELKAQGMVVTPQVAPRKR